MGKEVRDSAYLVLTCTKNRFSRFIAFFDRHPYSHASISTDDTLDHMYSFCRTTSKPFPATFHQELLTVNRAKFGPDFKVPCEVYRLPLSEEQLNKLDEIIEYYDANKSKYSYNLMGILTVYFGMNVERKNKYMCSQFVAHVLDKLEIEMPKPVFLMRPEDFRWLENVTRIYEGEINEYYNAKKNKG